MASGMSEAEVKYLVRYKRPVFSSARFFKAPLRMTEGIATRLLKAPLRMGMGNFATLTAESYLLTVNHY